MGFHLAVIHQAIAFAYLGFVPGFTLLRVLRVHSLPWRESLPYAVGLSTMWVMLIGLMTNILGHNIGIKAPLSLWPATLSVVGCTLLLAWFAYWRDRGFVPSAQTRQSAVPLYVVLGLVLLPIFSVLGIESVNYLHNDSLLLVNILLIGLVALAIAFNKLIPSALIPLAVLAVSAIPAFFYVASVFLCAGQRRCSRAISSKNYPSGIILEPRGDSGQL